MKAGFVKAEQDKIRRTQISMLEEQSLGVGFFSGRLGSCQKRFGYNAAQSGFFLHSISV